MANEFKVKKGLIINGSGGTLLDVQGDNGQIFSATDDIVTMGQFGSNALVVNGG